MRVIADVEQVLSHYWGRADLLRTWIDNIVMSIEVCFRKDHRSTFEINLGKEAFDNFSSADFHEIIRLVQARLTQEYALDISLELATDPGSTPDHEVRLSVEILS